MIHLIQKYFWDLNLTQIITSPNVFSKDSVPKKSYLLPLYLIPVEVRHTIHHKPVISEMNFSYSSDVA